MKPKRLLTKGILTALILLMLVGVVHAQLCLPPVISTQPFSRSVCNGGVTTFTVVAVGLNLNYQWQVNSGSGYTNCTNGTPYSGVLTSILSVSASAGMNGDKYRCIIFNSCGSITSGFCLLTVLEPNVTISASPSSAICLGSSTTLTASGASSYQWSTGATTASITVSPTSTTTYSVTGTNSLGCSKTASITITVNPLPNVTATASPATICAGGSSTLTASGAASYQWSTGETTASITVSPLTATTYSVTGVNNSGCSKTVSVKVSVGTPPNVAASASPSAICSGGSSTLTASGATQYQWSTGQTTASISVNPTSTTTYSVAGTSVGGCSRTASVTVSVSSTPDVTASASPSTICAGGSSTLTVSGATSYQWNTGQTTASTTVTPTSTTTYSVTGTNSSGCSKTATVTVSVGSCSVVCSGNITLTSQADVDAFPSVHGCTEITGKLTISGADINNLDGLYTLTKVGELLITGNGELTNLNGLSHLQTVTATCSSIGCGGTNMGFTINNNALLSDISGLSSLTKVEPDLVISSNPKLTNLEGLNNVVAVNGRLWIGDNASLANLNGLASLASIGFYQLGIYNNPSLTSLEGLRLITSIPGNLYISNNASLPNLNGLESLTQLKGAGGTSLTISNNASLTNIDALSSLQAMRGAGPATGLTVSNNPVLANLNGFRSLTAIAGNFSLGTLVITNNASLREVDGLSSLDTLSGFNLRVVIQDNSSLINVNGLSSIALSTPRPTILVNNNPALTEGCGLYGIVSYANHTSGGQVDVSGNGGGWTKAEILANGPCTQESAMKTSSLVFSAVTDTTMTVSFTAFSGNPDGYITLMQAFGSPYPDDVPVDGTVYQPGGTIGNSTIVNVGPETRLDIIYLSPGVDYYFDVFAYNVSNGNYDYQTVAPREGVQRTTLSGNPSARMNSNPSLKTSGYAEVQPGTRPGSPFPNPFSESITIPFTTDKQNTFVQIAIYDLTGKKIADVASQYFDPGYHETQWARTDNLGSRVSQGPYIYSIRSSETNAHLRGIVLVK